MIEPDWVDWLYPAPFNLVDIRCRYPNPKDAGERLQDWIEAREAAWQEQYDADVEGALQLHLRPHRCQDERGWLFWFDREQLCLTARALGVS